MKIIKFENLLYCNMKLIAIADFENLILNLYMHFVNNKTTINKFVFNKDNYQIHLYAIKK